MWKWIKEKCCCFGKKKEDEKNNKRVINNQNNANNYRTNQNVPYWEKLGYVDLDTRIQKIRDQADIEAKERERLSNEKDMQDKLDLVARYPSETAIHSDGRLVYIGNKNNSRRGSDSGNNSDIDLQLR